MIPESMSSERNISPPSSRKVLVTGAGGFIGSHLVEALVRDGGEVRAFIHYNALNSRGWLEALPEEILERIEIFAGDIRDPNGVRVAMKGCDRVCHLAALIGIPYSYHSPDSYVETNIRGTLNILQAGRDLQVRRIVQTSTSEVYGTARFVPITEEHPLQGQSPYSATKIGADQIALSFHRSFQTPVVIVRPFNTYGPRQSARAVIPTIIRQLLSGSGPLRLGAVTPTRDFNYVSDTVRGFQSALLATAEIEGEVINLGSNYEISILETARCLAELLGTKLEVEEDAQRLRPPGSEVERLWADNTKAGRLLGWKPEYAGHDGFRRGLERTIEWFRNSDVAGRGGRGAAAGYHV
jgi:NAD dependent epimerase/dehydratase